MKQYIIKSTAPAKKNHEGWERQSFPIGNSNMGMCIFGATDTERLQLNEKTIRTGGPSKSRPDYNGGNIEGSFEYLDKIRRAIEQGNEDDIHKYKDKLIGIMDGYGNYQPFGDILVTLNHKDVASYERKLCLNNAIATTSYTVNGVEYKHEHFASYPKRVLVSRFSSSEKERLSCTVTFETEHKSCKLDVGDNSITVSGALEDNELRLFSEIKIKTDGKSIASGEKIQISDASEVIIYCAIGTNYKQEYPVYRGENPDERVTSAVSTAFELDYEELKKEHIEDYQSLFNRADLELTSAQCTDTAVALIKNHKKNNASSRYLEELLFQYGRYLLIESSRGNDLPANLQGVWNDSAEPAWSCDYHLNVNLQMCYWNAYTTNLAECAKPMIKYMDSLREPGRVTAGIYHNIVSTKDNPENGWVCHTQNTIYGWTCPGWNFSWGWSPSASSWMLQNCFDYYLFTQDKAYLESDIYPMMKENCKFWIQNLCYDKLQDRYVSSPTFSPEHGPVSSGNTYEQTIIYGLFTDTICACEELGKDLDFADELKKIQAKLKPVSVGRWGQIKEWPDEDEWYKSKLFRRIAYAKHGAQFRHRHCSHLLGLYPYSIIDRSTPDLMFSAEVSLRDRGFGTRGFNDSGWGKANKICLWARLKNGKSCMYLIKDMIAKNFAQNLWDLHPPFQIDGNFGLCAGMAEMLLYSNNDYIELLPALPREWNSGSVKGLCARGGYTVDIAWKNGEITELNIYHSKKTDVKIFISPALKSYCTAENGFEINGEYAIFSKIKI